MLPVKVERRERKWKEDWPRRHQLVPVFELHTHRSRKTNHRTESACRNDQVMVAGGYYAKPQYE